MFTGLSVSYVMIAVPSTITASAAAYVPDRGSPSNARDRTAPMNGAAA